MKLYAASSAALAWLLEQEHGELVAETLAQAELIITSDLTLIECDRVLIRAVALNELQESDAAHRQARFNAVATRWTLLALDEEIIERARRPFPSEPIRALDAIHLASAVTARKAVSDLTMLSLDGRVRKAADRLGFPLLPADAKLTSNRQQQ
jgi:predicted nucleic acid-binding protein